MKKIGRNDPCVCGSGKKFKKCCESKMLGGRFMATKIDSGSADPIQKAVNMTSLFSAHLAQTPKKPEAPASVEEAMILEEKSESVEEKDVNLEQNLAEKETIC